MFLLGFVTPERAIIMLEIYNVHIDKLAKDFEEKMNEEGGEKT